jgi:Reverse transcriptase (RNA-dependent DNA polymerase)/Endonuclease-reverse transcriptase
MRHHPNSEWLNAPQTAGSIHPKNPSNGPAHNHTLEERKDTTRGWQPSDPYPFAKGDSNRQQTTTTTNNNTVSIQTTSTHSGVIGSSRPLDSTSNSNRQRGEVTDKVVQWNCNSFWTRYEDIKLMINEIQPTVLCLQETNLRKNEKPRLNGYVGFFDSKQRRLHGTAIFVKDNLKVTEIELDSTLNAVAVKVGLNREITICSLYLPPNDDTSTLKRDLQELIDQLPHPFILTGDLNAHNRMWGGREENPRGVIIEDITSNLDLTIINTGEQTYFNLPHKTTSAIDITITSPSLAFETDWYVDGQLRGSDHYPTVTTIIRGPSYSEPNKRPRWKLKTAKWDKYSKEVEETLEHNNQNIQSITKAIQNAANNNIKKTTGREPPKRLKWMTPEVQEAIRQRRRAERRLRNHRTTENIVEYKKLKAYAKLVMKRTRKEEWERYVNSITQQTPTTEIWGKIRQVSGKPQNNKVIRLRKPDGRSIEDPREIASELVHHFAKVSATSNYSQDFQEHKARVEKTPLAINMENEEDYNKPYTTEELEIALEGCQGTSPGPDNITYEMIKNLSPRNKEQLVHCYNKIWTEGCLPKEWKVSLVVPIRKPGKNPEDVNNYRPINLTSCLSKTFERMVNRRLVHILEDRDLLPNEQFGFRKARSTTDALNVLETKICETFLEEKYMALLSLDLSKAYDTCWRRGIVNWLDQKNVKGRMLKYAENFMDERLIKVIIGNTESEELTIENGVVQGAVISVTLFLAAIADITKIRREEIEAIGYADDWNFWAIGDTPRIANNLLQEAAHHLTTWCDKTGFSISTEKTKVMMFTRLAPRGVDPYEMTVEIRGTK